MILSNIRKEHNSQILLAWGNKLEGRSTNSPLIRNNCITHQPIAVYSYPHRRTHTTSRCNLVRQVDTHSGVCSMEYPSMTKLGDWDFIQALQINNQCQHSCMILAVRQVSPFTMQHFLPWKTTIILCQVQFLFSIQAAQKIQRNNSLSIVCIPKLPQRHRYLRKAIISESSSGYPFL
jgi:hypothetical protein